MDCSDCAVGVETQLRKITGVIEANVSAMTNKAEVAFDFSKLEDSLAQKAMIKAVLDLGYKAFWEGIQKPFDVDASKNIHEFVLSTSIRPNNFSAIEKIEQLIQNHPGVQKYLLTEEKLVTVHKFFGRKNKTLEFMQLMIQYDAQLTGVRTLLAKIRQILPDETIVLFSMDQKVISNTINETIIGESQIQAWKRATIFCSILSIPVVLLAFIFPLFSDLQHHLDHELFPHSHLSIQNGLEWIFSTPILFWIGRPLFNSAWRSLYYQKKANMDVLVVISTCTAYIYSVVSVILNMFGIEGGMSL
jgi:Cu+-exporting ATPase